ncbi:unnamed protein product [Rotaria sp. Silwood2]|nr:unnamed protein product [Rotaria sp. Silwood2]CAF4391488.1 unnamed protein product [Rotaria sp. Silwood2]
MIYHDLDHIGLFFASVSDDGSDWSTIYFMSDASRKKLDDVIIRTKFSSLRWATDNRSIFYATYAGALDNTASNNNSTTSTEKAKDKSQNEVTSATIEVTHNDIQEVYFHLLGTSLETSDDEQYLIVSISKDILCENKFWFLSLSNSSNSIVEQRSCAKLINHMDFVYDCVT